MSDENDDIDCPTCGAPVALDNGVYRYDATLESDIKRVAQMIADGIQQRKERADHARDLREIVERLTRLRNVAYSGHIPAIIVSIDAIDDDVRRRLAEIKMEAGT